MSYSYVKRSGKRFVVDKTQLSTKANKTDIINSLYAAIYDEFKGAALNPKYADMTPVKRLEELNTFTHEWLKERGLL